MNNWLSLKEIKDAQKKAKELSDKVHSLSVYTNLDNVIDLIRKKDNINIDVIEVDFKSLDKNNELYYSEAGAFIYKEDENIKVVLNQRVDPLCQRFSLAHELGHYVLGHLDDTQMVVSFNISCNLNMINSDTYENDDDMKKEQAANIFALELLVPKKKLELYKNNIKNKILSIKDVSKIFKVTPSAIFAQLSIIEEDYE